MRKEVVVSVAEPWDFESEAGPNVLRARLVDRTADADGNPAWVVRVDRELQVGERRGRYLVMYARHGEEPLGGLDEGGKVHVNLALIPTADGDWRKHLADAVLAVVGTAQLVATEGGASDDDDDTDPLRP
jgi:hypothetical protein